MKQETLEEIAEKWFEEQEKLNYSYDSKQSFIEGYKLAKEQDKKMYSEKEVLEFTQTMIQKYKFGNINIEQLDLLKKNLEHFKNK